MEFSAERIPEPSIDFTDLLRQLDYDGLLVLSPSTARMFRASDVPNPEDEGLFVRYHEEQTYQVQYDSILPKQSIEPDEALATTRESFVAAAEQLINRRIPGIEWQECFQCRGTSAVTGGCSACEGLGVTTAFPVLTVFNRDTSRISELVLDIPKLILEGKLAVNFNEATRTARADLPSLIESVVIDPDLQPNGVLVEAENTAKELKVVQPPLFVSKPRRRRVIGESHPPFDEAYILDQLQKGITRQQLQSDLSVRGADGRLKGMFIEVAHRPNPTDQLHELIQILERNGMKLGVHSPEIVTGQQGLALVALAGGNEYIELLSQEDTFAIAVENARRFVHNIL